MRRIAVESVEGGDPNAMVNGVTATPSDAGCNPGVTQQHAAGQCGVIIAGKEERGRGGKLIVCSWSGVLLVPGFVGGG